MTIYATELAKYRMRVEVASLVPDYRNVRAHELEQIVGILDKMIKKEAARPRLSPIPENYPGEKIS